MKWPWLGKRPYKAVWKIHLRDGILPRPLKQLFAGVRQEPPLFWATLSTPNRNHFVVDVFSTTHVRLCLLARDIGDVTQENLIALGAGSRERA